MISKFLSKSGILWVDLEFLDHTQVENVSTSWAEMFMLFLGCLSYLCSFFSDHPLVNLLVENMLLLLIFSRSLLEDFIECILYVFSPFSPRLSAFVLRCFLEADPYIDIDENVLHRTYTWLKGRQKSNGEFWEPGRVIHSELQGGNKSPVTLTAYIVTSLLGYKKYQVFNL